MRRTKRSVRIATDQMSLKERWTALLERVRSRVPADVTDEELDRDIREAIQEARQEQRERASRP
jgi:hypothetical protein